MELCKMKAYFKDWPINALAGDIGHTETSHWFDVFALLKEHERNNFWVAYAILVGSPALSLFFVYENHHVFREEAQRPLCK